MPSTKKSKRNGSWKLQMNHSMRWPNRTHADHVMWRGSTCTGNTQIESKNEKPHMKATFSGFGISSLSSCLLVSTKATKKHDKGELKQQSCHDPGSVTQCFVFWIIYSLCFIIAMTKVCVLVNTAIWHIKYNFIQFHNLFRAAHL